MENVRKIVVLALWDSEAKVWVAESKDVPGLITEAQDTNALVTKLLVLIPELLLENHSLPEGPGTLDISIRYRGQDHLQVAAA